MTFNIRFKNEEDKKIGKGWKNRLPMIVDIINTFQPDIIGLQEAKKEQIDDLNKSLSKKYNWFGKGRKYYRGIVPLGGEYNPIFFRKDVLKKLNEDTFWLNKDGTKGKPGWDARDPRICTWGEFKIESNKKKFFFFNTHLDHLGRTSRVESSKLLGKKITNKTNNNTVPAILVGDFNDTLKAERTTKISGIFFHNPYQFALAKEKAQKVVGPVGTFTGFTGINTTSVLDYIVLNKAELFQVLQYGVVERKDHDHASDHRPIFVDIRIN